MAEEYPIGKNRIFYRAAGVNSEDFVEPDPTTVDLLNPELVNNVDIKLTKVKSVKGLYYFDYSFNQEGVWVGVFYENGDEKTTQYFRIKREPKGGFRSSPGNNVINIS